MPKLTLTDLTSLTNQTSAISTINANNALIEALAELLVSRDGTAPNTMTADLDINSKKLLNVASGTAAADGVNYAQLTAATGQVPGNSMLWETATADSDQGAGKVWGNAATASITILYVDDAADGIVRATRDYNESEPVNLGSGSEISIRELAELICEVCGFAGEIRWNAEKPDGQPRRCLDTTRALAKFGFEARTSLRDGLMQTVQWYREKCGRLAA